MNLQEVKIICLKKEEAIIVCWISFTSTNIFFELWLSN